MCKELNAFFESTFTKQDTANIPEVRQVFNGDYRRRRRRNSQAQAKASMPGSITHMLIT